MGITTYRNITKCVSQGRTIKRQRDRGKAYTKFTVHKKEKRRRLAYWHSKI